MPAKTVSRPEPLRAFGPAGQVIATSVDGGKVWAPTAEGIALEAARHQPKPRQFDRRVAAVVDGSSPVFDRRIATTFSVMHEAGIMAGWAPYDALAAMGDQEMDGLVITDANMPLEKVAVLRRVGRSLILDLDSSVSLEAQRPPNLDALLGLVDAVTVHNDMTASRIRPYHARVFVVPDLLRGEYWQKAVRHVAPKRELVVGVPADASEAMLTAVEHLAAKFGSRVVWQSFAPWALFPAQEPDVYLEFDVVLLPQPAERHQASLARVLPAMAASCCVVADRHWPLVRHDQTGVQIARDTALNWTTMLNQTLMDNRKRILVGRNARLQARRWTPETRLHQVALPYRLVVPKGDPFTVG